MAARLEVTHGRDPLLCFFCQVGKRRVGLACTRCDREHIKSMMWCRRFPTTSALHPSYDRPDKRVILGAGLDGPDSYDPTIPVWGGVHG